MSAEVDSAIDLVVSHKFPWCRARLLHALAGAAEQGVLTEVIHELLDDDGPDRLGGAAAARLCEALKRTGWTPHVVDES